MYIFAVSRSGFSRKESTLNISLLRIELTLRSACMYPYPVSGRVGFMPRVTIESVSAVKFRHDLMTRWNSTLFVTIWSLGETTMLAFGSTDFILQLT